MIYYFLKYFFLFPMWFKFYESRGFVLCTSVTVAHRTVWSTCKKVNKYLLNNMTLIFFIRILKLITYFHIPLSLKRERFILLFYIWFVNCLLLWKTADHRFFWEDGWFFFFYQFLNTHFLLCYAYCLIHYEIIERNTGSHNR